jgi:hypothetical protein
MSTTFRGLPEEFSNLFHYDAPTLPTDTELSDILDQLVTQLKTVHSPLVTFVRGRVWGPTDQGPAASETRVIKDYSGVGSMATAGGAIYKECTVLVEWYLGRAPITGRKRILKKFIHCESLPGSSAGARGEQAIGSGNKTPFITFGNAVKNLSSGGRAFPICAPNGDHLPLATDPTVNDYLRVRQFKQ